MALAVINSEEITHYIAHREPILMVNNLKILNKNQGLSSFQILPANIFLNSSATLTQEGYLEHIAQSSAAMIGFFQEKTIVGYIGEISDCCLFSYDAKVGDCITTEINVLYEFEKVYLISATSSVNHKKIVDCKMKLSINNDIN